MLSLFHLFRREIPAAMAYLDAADMLAAEQHLSPFLNSSVVHSALAMAENRADEAVANIRKGIEIGQASKPNATVLSRPPGGGARGGGR